MSWSAPANCSTDSWPSGFERAIIPLAYAILRQLDIPTYVLFDGDAGLEDRLKAKSSVSEAAREAQLETTAKKNRDLLRLSGDEEEDWPARAVRGGSANFHDRLEGDLTSIWPDFAPARDQVAAELGIEPKSDEAYRQAVALAGEPPEFLTDLVARVKGLL